MGDDLRQHDPQCDSCRRPQGAEGCGLDQELREDVATPGAKRFPDADLPGPLGHSNQHDVHDHDGAHHQPDGGQDDRGDDEILLDRLPRRQRRIWGLQREVVGLAGVQFVPDTHDLPHLLLDIGQNLIVRRLDDDRVDDAAITVEEPMDRGAIGRDNELVEGEAERAALFLRDTHDLVGHARDANRPADRIDGREEVRLDVLPNDHDERARFELLRREFPPADHSERFDREVVAGHRVREHLPRPGER